MDFEQAKAYAVASLEENLPPHLYYHGVHHTRNDVVPAALRLAEAHDLDPTERNLVLTAAWYHDIGFTQRYKRNEVIGVQIARDILPKFGYTPDHLDRIQGMIMATQLPQQPKTLLEEIMVDADMDSLGRDDLFQVAMNLRREEEIWLNRHLTDAEWTRMEMKFLSSHRYFTAAQRHARNTGKVKNFLMFYRSLPSLPASTG